jgi:hypothetical protein
MFENFDFRVTTEQMQAYQQWQAAIMQNFRNLGIDPGTTFEPLAIDPALEQAVQVCIFISFLVFIFSLRLGPSPLPPLTLLLSWASPIIPTWL